jgi:hypothetical protein
MFLPFRWKSSSLRLPSEESQEMSRVVVEEEEEDLLLSRVGDGKCSSSSEGVPSSEGTSYTTEDSHFSVTDETLDNEDSLLAANPSTSDWRVNTKAHGHFESPSHCQVHGKEHMELPKFAHLGVDLEREEPDGCSVSLSSACDSGSGDS